MERFVTGRMEAHRLPGLALAITRGPEVIAVQGYGVTGASAPVTGETQFLIASLSKSFMAAAVLQLVALELCHGIGGVYGRKAMQRWLDPIVVAAGAMTVAALLSGLITWASPALGIPAPVNLGQLSPFSLPPVVFGD